MLIQAHNPKWKVEFSTIKKILEEHLAGLIITIEHIGSTSVPNLAAKAIIDIDIVYDNASFFPKICEKLAIIGYYHNGNQGIPQREAFKRKKEGNRHPILDSIPHHLYACPKDSSELKLHLLFRDYLRNHEWARFEYAALKIEIAAKTNQNKKAYSLLKETMAKPFIAHILKLAILQRITRTDKNLKS